jgi:hypothetical protein
LVRITLPGQDGRAVYLLERRHILPDRQRLLKLPALNAD